MIAIALALGRAGEQVEKVPDTERTIAAVVVEGIPFPTAKMVRCQDAWWVERLLGKRERFDDFDGAMKALQHVAEVYDGKVCVQ